MTFPQFIKLRTAIIIDGRIIFRHNLIDENIDIEYDNINNLFYCTVLGKKHKSIDLRHIEYYIYNIYVKLNY